MTKTLEKTLTQRVTALEAENAELRKTISCMEFEINKMEGGMSVHQIWCKDLRKRLDALEREENLLPPPQTPEEEKRAEELDRYHRIGI